MTFYVYSPDWFSGIDSFLEIISILTSFVICYFSYKTYKYSGIKKYKYFSFAFLLIGLAFIFKIVSNILIVVPVKRAIQIDFATLVYTNYQNIYLFESIGFFLHKLFLLIGLLILYLIVVKEDKLENILIMSILMLIMSYTIESFLLFNFVITVIALFLFLTNYIRNDKIIPNKILNKKKKHLSNLSMFFLGLVFSFIFFIITILNEIFYVVAEICLFLSFCFLLYEFFMVFRK